MPPQPAIGRLDANGLKSLSHRKDLTGKVSGVEARASVGKGPRSGDSALPAAWAQVEVDYAPWARYSPNLIQTCLKRVDTEMIQAHTGPYAVEAFRFKWKRAEIGSNGQR